MRKSNSKLAEVKALCPEKFASEEEIFSHIHRGDRLFIGTGCGQPQYLIRALMKYVESHPNAFFDVEVIHLWTVGVAPYTDERFKRNFRHTSFFVGNSTREAVNEGLADYTPIALSQLPGLLYRGVIPVDIALIQTSTPDEHGYVSLGINVDITKAATECASTVIAQVNENMPRVHGDSFLSLEELDFIVPYDEPLLQITPRAADEVAQRIGKYVARLVHDGDTIQVGFGRIPNAVAQSLADKEDLGVHSEILTDGVVQLMKKGAVNNSKKTLNRGKTVASFCMGSRETYEYLHDNPKIDFRTIDYTDNPLVVAQHENISAINSALQVDLTGQATAESIGKTFYAGIGGQADFSRGAMLARGGRTIVTLHSTTQNDTISRIVPYLSEGAGVTLCRSDIHYVVTEHGIAYLHGQSVRHRAMQLISIAHPKFRNWLIEEARKMNLIYKDQVFVDGKAGEYPEELETQRVTGSGVEVLIRPIRISDEPLLKDFWYHLSDRSMYLSFISARKDMSHERLQEMMAIDYTQQMALVAVISQDEKQNIIGVARYFITPDKRIAEVTIVVRDDYQSKGVGRELFSYLTYLAKKNGLVGFTAEVLVANTAIIRLFKRMGFDIQTISEDGGVYEMKLMFR
ncbi:MAG: GNAT family N-acetyltransferase [Chloroflexi bacterium]|nr:GNAT family N-acetyltransferase [Chloroflexota bacterium]